MDWGFLGKGWLGWNLLSMGLWMNRESEFGKSISD